MNCQNLSVCVVSSDIVTAFDRATIGTKVLNMQFCKLLCKAVEAYDFTKGTVPGQAMISMPEGIPYVSAGVGRRRDNIEDYVIRSHRGRADVYLKRAHAADVNSLACVVYTKAAYLADPDITAEEGARIIEENATHVLVAVLAAAGPIPPLPVYRLVWNLAGGNNEALVWDADTIRAKAKETIDYDNEWCTVAD